MKSEWDSIVVTWGDERGRDLVRRAEESGLRFRVERPGVQLLQSDDDEPPELGVIVCAGGAGVGPMHLVDYTDLGTTVLAMLLNEESPPPGCVRVPVASDAALMDALFGLQMMLGDELITMQAEDLSCLARGPERAARIVFEEGADLRTLTCRVSERITDIGLPVVSVAIFIQGGPETPLSEVNQTVATLSTAGVTHEEVALAFSYGCAGPAARAAIFAMAFVGAERKEADIARRPHAPTDADLEEIEARADRVSGLMDATDTEDMWNLVRSDLPNLLDEVRRLRRHRRSREK